MGDVVFDKAYPTYDEDGNETAWHVVAYDPRGLMYSDEDWRAMDVTNFTAFKSGLSEEDENLYYADDAWDADEGQWWEGRADEFPYDTRYHDPDRPYSWSTPVIIVRKGREASWRDDDTWDDGERDAWQWWEECAARIANYPLLDEDAYSELESEAWQEYAPIAFEDEIRDAQYPWDRETRQRVEGWMDEETAEALKDAADEILPEICQHLDYNNGFSGEYGPPMLEIVADMIGSLLPGSRGES